MMPVRQLDGGMLRLLPGRDGTDGFFMAVLHRGGAGCSAMNDRIKDVETA